MPGKPHSVGKVRIIQMQKFLSGEKSGGGVPDQFYVNGGDKFVNIMYLDNLYSINPFYRISRSSSHKKCISSDYNVKRDLWNRILWQNRFKLFEEYHFGEIKPVSNW